ncbi:MAG: ABC transporter ATP-binding protein [Crenarchaeota archaeon]|nr:ABC transporter ATP-binding protein [Thermoproteota archaeon]
MTLEPLPPDVALRTINLKKYYLVGGLFSPKRTVKAVDGVDVELRDEVYCVVGESGCGKSTFARVVIGLEEPTEGDVLLRVSDGVASELSRMGEEVVENTVSYRRLSPKGKRIVKRDIQMVWQDPYSSIDPKMRVWEAVAEPLLVHKLVKSKEEARRRAIEAMKRAKLTEDLADRYPHQLSGGQRQRVVIARALSINPKVIVADEPVSMLDVSIRAEIINLLRELHEREGLSMIVITHDLSTTPHLCDRIGVMYLGRIVEEGPTEEVLRSPLHPYTKALLAAVLEPDPENRRRKLEVPIKGEVSAAPPKGCRFRPRCVLVDERRELLERCSEDEPPLTGEDHKVACWGAQ